MYKEWKIYIQLKKLPKESNKLHKSIDLHNDVTASEKVFICKTIYYASTMGVQ